jgi:hypothetical protein
MPSVFPDRLVSSRTGDDPIPENPLPPPQPHEDVEVEEWIDAGEDVAVALLLSPGCGSERRGCLRMSSER